MRELTNPQPKTEPVYPTEAELYLTLAADACYFVCGNVSLNSGGSGLYLGYGGGIGIAQGAGIGIGPGYGQFAQTGNVSVECAGFLPEGMTAGANLSPFGLYATGGYGVGGGCSLNFVNCQKLN